MQLTQEAAQPQPELRNPWQVVGTVCIGAFMAALDASVVTIALPTLHGYFQTSTSVVDWVSVAYLLTLSSLLLILGRFADHFGRSRMYTFGFAVFIVGSALCGAAPSVVALIGFRVLQAVGAAMLQVNSVALVTQYTPPAQRGRAIGIQGAAQALGLSAGPAIGGALIALSGWRSIFYVNVPVGLLGILMAQRLLPRDVDVKPLDGFDRVGSVLMILAMVGIIWPLNDGYRIGWSSPATWGSLAIGLAAAAAFIRQERLAKAPLLNMAFFKNHTFFTGNISGMLSYAVMYGTLFLWPWEFKTVQHLPVSQGGLILTAVPIAMTVLSPIAGRSADRIGGKSLTIVGMAISAGGAVLLALSTAQTSLVPIIVGLTLVGAGMGLFTAPNNSSVMGVVPRHDLSSAGGFLNMARSLGMSLGVALAGTIFASILLGALGTESVSPAQAPIASQALSVAYLAVAIAAIVAAIISALRPRSSASSGDESVQPDLI